MSGTRRALAGSTLNRNRHDEPADSMSQHRTVPSPPKSEEKVADRPDEGAML